MLKHNWKIFFVFLSQVIDILAIAISGSVIFYLKWTQTVEYVTPDQNLFVGLIIFSFIYLVVASMLGLYRGSFHLSLRLQNLITARAFIISILIALAINSFSQTFVGKKSVITFALLSPVLLLSARLFLRQVNLYFQDLGYGVHNSVIAGFHSEALRLNFRFATFPELGYKVKGFLVKRKDPQGSMYRQITRHEIEKVIETEYIDRIFIPTTEFSLNGYSYLQGISEQKGVKLKIISPQAEDVLKNSRIYDIAGISLTTPHENRVRILKKISKRLFDILSSIIIIILLSPVFIITITAIVIESGWPVFFLQKRVSLKGGKEFNFVKFRSMVTNAEELKEELRNHNETDGVLFKMKHDPRITYVGKFIRKFSIDELPQLFNVLKGDMSLVGPRPLPINDILKFNESDEFWEAIKDRGLVKSGMTGLWQISGRSDIKFKEMILLDLYYVENHSILFDLEILFETIPVVLFGRGAY